MSMLKVATTAISLAKQAASSDAAAREPELQSCLTDLLVHLGVWRTHTAAAFHEQYTVVSTAPAADDDVEPTLIVGSAR